MNDSDVTYFDRFVAEHNSKEIKTFIDNIKTNIYVTHAHDSIMCVYFCIEFVDFMFKGKSLKHFTNEFSSNNLKNNDRVILSYFLN